MLQQGTSEDTPHTPRTACLAGLGGELADVLSSSRTSRVPPCTPARSTRQATPRQAQGALVIKVACSSLLLRNLISLSWCAHTTAQAADQVKRWLRISLDSIASKTPWPSRIRRRRLPVERAYVCASVGAFPTTETPHPLCHIHSAAPCHSGFSALSTTMLCWIRLSQRHSYCLC